MTDRAEIYIQYLRAKRKFVAAYKRGETTEADYGVVCDAWARVCTAQHPMYAPPAGDFFRLSWR